MPDPELLRLLRALDEADIAAALERAYIALPVTSAVEAVELVNVVLDHITGERAKAEREDEERISRERKRLAH